jgi:hypothetical protein
MNNKQIQRRYELDLTLGRISDLSEVDAALLKLLASKLRRELCEPGTSNTNI